MDIAHDQLLPPNLPLTRDDDEGWVDEALAPFRDLVSALTATSDPIGDKVTGVRTYLESLRLSLPFEMDVLVEESGRVRLAGAPPTQYTKTTILPVFHRLTLNIGADSHQ